MNADELVTAVRVTGALPEADPTYTDAVVRDELHHMLTTLFERTVVVSREGYWRKFLDYTVQADQQRYRLPPRACSGTAESIEFFSGQPPIPFFRERPGYTFQGDQIVLDSPPQTSCTLRVHYYLRPSKLVQPQTEGRVVAFDNVAKTITVNALPLDQRTEIEIGTGDRIDVIHPNGWHEVYIVDQPVAVDVPTLTLTFGPSVDLSQVEIGDYVRAADQTDWPALPEDFHRTLCDAAASAILVSKGDIGKAQTLASKVNGDTERFTDLLNPRVKDNPPATVPRFGVNRSRARYWGARLR